MTSAAALLAAPAFLADANSTAGAEIVAPLQMSNTAAAFDVAGEADYSYAITLPSSVNISNGSGGTMAVNNFTGSKASGTLTAGADDFTVGGTLTVAANQASGEYTGTFAITVEYQ
ncbi:MAG: DUF4402 domain-containing protein [Henriciella sp.]|jgi:hypothetical protein